MHLWKIENLLDINFIILIVRKIVLKKFWKKMRESAVPIHFYEGLEIVEPVVMAVLVIEESIMVLIGCKEREDI